MSLENEIHARTIEYMMSDRDTDVLLEDINHQLKAILEGQAAMANMPADIAEIKVRLTNVESDIGAIKAAIKDETRESRAHDNQLYGTTNNASLPWSRHPEGQTNSGDHWVQVALAFNSRRSSRNCARTGVGAMPMRLKGGSSLASTASSISARVARSSTCTVTTAK
jgi:hypothetical protein